MTEDARLARLASWLKERDWAVEESGLTALLAYLDAMLVQNREINLTAFRDPEQALILHVLDSLAPASLGLDPQSCLDLGSGNGFPGLALRTLYPEVELTLLDRTAKKLRAIERALADAGLPAVETLHLDARQAAESSSFDRKFDLIAVRAMATPAEIAPLAAPLLGEGGTLLLWLAGDADAPKRLPKRLRLSDQLGYELPEPARRQRKLAVYRLGHRGLRAATTHRNRDESE